VARYSAERINNAIVGRWGPHTPEERFWAKVDKDGPNGCWLWLASIDAHGYSHAGKGRLAYRLAYQLVRGPVPAGLELDHLCRNKLCVNPDHLEPVTHAENVRRGALHRRRVTCEAGHLLALTRKVVNGRSKGCRVCKQMRDARRGLSLLTDSEGAR
jgi:hypothetical protein